VSAHVIAVTEIGWKARSLIDDAAAAVVVAALSRSVYLEVRGEIVWLGPRGSALHGRAIVAGALPDVEAGARIDLSFDLRAAREWHPVEAPAASPDVVRREGRRLVAAIAEVGRPDGFGALMVGARPSFPLAQAADDARGFLDACAADEAGGAVAVAERLLGLGPGLTPAGDDLIGGAFFAKTFVGAGDQRWRDAAQAVHRRARERTHPISAMLLGDLVGGHGHAPLHDLVIALALADGRAAAGAAARLVGIGHSSGWDMLTGVLGALGALRGR